MYIDENGTVQHDNRMVSKCDLCPDQEVPACVAHCPNKALSYVEEYIE